MKLSALNTIKFKLILVISVLIVITSITSTVIINAAVRYRPDFYLAPLPGQQITISFNQSEFEARLEQERTERNTRVLLVSVLVVAIQVILASIGIYFTVRRMLAPLEELNEIMMEINEKRLYQEIEVEQESTEIIRLISNFNSMMQRLNKAFASQKQFVQNVSHEIKTPLTVIKTNLESVLLDKDLSTEELNAAIDTSIKSIDFLNNLAEDLLLLSLLDSSELEMSETNVGNVTNEAISGVQTLASKKQIELVAEVGTELIARANPVLLQRAIANLLENAVKYSPAGSTVQIVATQEGNDITVAVSDQGSGIPPKYKAKVFERFFRVDPSRSRHTGGTGLGLAIAREIVLGFQGKLTLNSTTRGSTFTIALPAHSSQ